MGIAATALLILLLLTGATGRLDNSLYDLSLKLDGRAPRSDIVIVAIDPKSFEKIGPWPWPRSVQARLVNAIARDKPKALGMYLAFLNATNSGDDKLLHDAMLRVPTFVPLVPDPDHGKRMLKPIASIGSVIAGVGAGEQNVDPDGIVRRTSLSERHGRARSSRLIVQMARLAGGRAASARSNPSEALIPYAGPAGSFPIISAADVIEGSSPPRALHGKYVLLGPTAPGMLVEHPTPTAKSMSNVEVEANTLNGLLERRLIFSATPLEVLAASLPLLWLLLYALLRLGPRENLRVAAALIVLPLVGSVIILISLRIWLPPVSLLLTVGIVTVYWGWRRLHAASDFLAEELRGLQSHIDLTGEGRSLARDGDVVLQQMTLLQEAKKRISDLRRFVSDILANFPDPIFVVALDGEIRTVNEAGVDLARRLGLSAAADAPIDAILARIIPMAKDAEPRWPSLAELAMRSGATELDRALTGRGPDGRAFEMRFTPTLSASDEPTGWIVHLSDVTVLMLALDQRELAQRQREEALQLLSHDMRSPQASILAALKHPEFRGVPTKLVELVDSQARRTLDMADAFVRLAQAESAEFTLRVLDFSHIAEEAIDAVWSLSQQGGVTLELRSQGEFLVMADRSAMMRALVNLLDNAIKFSTRGTAVVCNVRPTMIEGREAVGCEIIDSAGGMPAALATRVFDRFASVGQAANGSSGVGLGLALVQAVAARHQGSIVCRSSPGIGSVFTLTLPLHRESEGFDTLRASA